MAQVLHAGVRGRAQTKAAQDFVAIDDPPRGAWFTAHLFHPHDEAGVTVDVVGFAETESVFMETRTPLLVGSQPSLASVYRWCDELHHRLQDK